MICLAPAAVAAIRRSTGNYFVWGIDCAWFQRGGSGVQLVCHDLLRGRRSDGASQGAGLLLPAAAAAVAVTPAELMFQAQNVPPWGGAATGSILKKCPMPPTPPWPPNQCVFKGVSRVLRVVLRGPNALPGGGHPGLRECPMPPTPTAELGVSFK